MNLTLRQLEYFSAVAEHESFQRAAKACAVTQPGLSAQLAQLEDQLGVRLFERGRRGVLITPAGAALLSRAQRVLLEARDLEEAARGEAEPLSGDLRLGVIPTLAPYLLPRALAAVRAKYPALRLLLREDQTSRLVELLWKGELDLLLLALQAPLEGLKTRELFRDPFLLAVPPEHRLARRKRVREQELAGEPVLLLEDGH
jgi:LysR family hydrogen peroxide-inducible transcriptional activator